MIRKLLFAAVGVCVAMGLVRAATVAPGVAMWDALVIGFVGYLLWRALPHLREDLARIIPRPRHGARARRAGDGAL